MDFELAPPVREVLGDAVGRGDTGYPVAAPLEAAFAAFAAARYGWRGRPGAVRPVADVMTAVAELLRALTDEADAVVVNPPIYPPFRSVTAELGRRIVEAPLAASGAGYRARPRRAQARLRRRRSRYLLCHPHNPTGRSLPRDELEAIADARRPLRVTVISDEIHAPMTLPGASHIPFSRSAGEAAIHGVAITGASKAWNIAGLKCALIVTGSAEMDARLAESLSTHLAYHVGHLGVLASTRRVRARRRPGSTRCA